MTGFKYICRADGKKVAGLCGVLLVIAAIALVALNFNFGNTLVLQLVLLGCLGAAVYFWITYISTCYIYEVMQEGDALIFLVIRQQGRKLATQCKFSLSAFYAMTSTDKEHPMDEQSFDRTCRYSSVLFPDGYDVLYFRDGSERVALQISVNDAFKDAMAAYLPPQEPADNAAPPSSSEA